MKKLELKQMELLEGGSTIGCVGAVIGAVALGAALVAVSGPIGAWAWVSLIGGGMAEGLSIADCTAEYVL